MNIDNPYKSIIDNKSQIIYNTFNKGEYFINAKNNKINITEYSNILYEAIRDWIDYYILYTVADLFDPFYLLILLTLGLIALNQDEIINIIKNIKDSNEKNIICMLLSFEIKNGAINYDDISSYQYHFFPSIRIESYKNKNIGYYVQTFSFYPNITSVKEKDQLSKFMSNTLGIFNNIHTNQIFKYSFLSYVSDKVNKYREELKDLNRNLSDEIKNGKHGVSQISASFEIPQINYTITQNQKRVSVNEMKPKDKSPNKDESPKQETTLPDKDELLKKINTSRAFLNEMYNSYRTNSQLGSKIKDLSGELNTQQINLNSEGEDLHQINNNLREIFQEVSQIEQTNLLVEQIYQVVEKFKQQFSIGKQKIIDFIFDAENKISGKENIKWEELWEELKYKQRWSDDDLIFVINWALSDPEKWAKNMFDESNLDGLQSDFYKKMDDHTSQVKKSLLSRDEINFLNSIPMVDFLDFLEQYNNTKGDNKNIKNLINILHKKQQNQIFDGVVNKEFAIGIKSKDDISDSNINSRRTQIKNDLLNFIKEKNKLSENLKNQIMKYIESPSKNYVVQIANTDSNIFKKAMDEYPEVIFDKKLKEKLSRKIYYLNYNFFKHVLSENDKMKILQEIISTEIINDSKTDQTTNSKIEGAMNHFMRIINDINNIPPFQRKRKGTSLKSNNLDYADLAKLDKEKFVELVKEYVQEKHKINKESILKRIDDQIKKTPHILNSNTLFLEYVFRIINFFDKNELDENFFDIEMENSFFDFAFDFLQRNKLPQVPPIPPVVQFGQQVQAQVPQAQVPPAMQFNYLSEEEKEKLEQIPRQVFFSSVTSATGGKEFGQKLFEIVQKIPDKELSAAEKIQIFYNLIGALESNDQIRIFKEDFFKSIDEYIKSRESEIKITDDDVNRINRMSPKIFVSSLKNNNILKFFENKNAIAKIKELDENVSKEVWVPFVRALVNLIKNKDNIKSFKETLFKNAQNELNKQEQEEARRQAEAERRRQAEAERRRQAEAERRRQAEEAERRRQAEEAERRRQAEEAEEAERRRQAEAERKRKGSVTGIKTSPKDAKSFSSDSIMLVSNPAIPSIDSFKSNEEKVEKAIKNLRLMWKRELDARGNTTIKSIDSKTDGITPNSCTIFKMLVASCDNNDMRNCSSTNPGRCKNIIDKIKTATTSTIVPIGKIDYDKVRDEIKNLNPAFAYNILEGFGFGYYQTKYRDGPMAGITRYRVQPAKDWLRELYTNVKSPMCTWGLRSLPSHASCPGLKDRIDTNLFNELKSLAESTSQNDISALNTLVSYFEVLVAWVDHNNFLLNKEISSNPKYKKADADYPKESEMYKLYKHYPGSAKGIQTHHENNCLLNAVKNKIFQNENNNNDRFALHNIFTTPSTLSNPLNRFMFTTLGSPGFSFTGGYPGFDSVTHAWNALNLQSYVSAPVLSDVYQKVMDSISNMSGIKISETTLDKIKDKINKFKDEEEDIIKSIRDFYEKIQILQASRGYIDPMNLSSEEWESVREKHKDILKRTTLLNHRAINIIDIMKTINKAVLDSTGSDMGSSIRYPLRHDIHYP